MKLSRFALIVNYLCESIRVQSEIKFLAISFKASNADTMVVGVGVMVMVD